MTEETGMIIPEGTDVEGAIAEGVKQAILEIFQGSTLYRDDITDAIEEGVHRAFDLLFAEDIKNSITDGVKEAMKS